MRNFHELNGLNKFSEFNERNKLNGNKPGGRK